MDSLFGLPMNALLFVMLALLAVSLATIVYIALRNRIMFLMGVRNIPRRVAQTVLIIVGLMLSTLIISAAFTTGDTVDYSITNEVYRVYGHVDEIIEFESQGDAPAPDVHIPQSAFNELEAEVGDDPNIDGMSPAAVEVVPVVDLERRQSEPNANFMGIDETRQDAFPDIQDLDGNPLELASLDADEVFVNESLADELDTAAGNEITVYYENQPIVLRVAGIAKDRGITGSFGGSEGEGLVTRLSTLQGLLGRQDEIDIIVVSNTGDLREGVKHTGAVESRLQDAFETRDLQLEVGDTKADVLDQAELAGNGMMTFFLVFGMFSIAAGILLIVMIFVMLAAERKSELGMARALGTKRWHLVETFVAEGMGYNLASAFVGAALGVLVAFGLAQVLASIFASSEEFSFSIEPYVTPRSLAISYSLGVVLTFLTVSFSSWRASRLNIVRAIRDLPEPETKPSGRSLIIALVLAPVGTLIMLGAFPIESAFIFGVGFLVAALSAALLARQARLPERAAFTGIGLFVLIFWAMTAGERIPGLNNLNGGPEMFILSGIMMVAASTYVLVYNADLLLAAITFAGGRLRRLLPAVRMAVAYPLASKFRTGMTLAMIALVVFALTMMSMMNTNFDQVFLNDDNFGGWDVEVRENPSNPLVGGLETALTSTDPKFDTGEFEAVGALAIAQPFGAELCQPEEHEGECQDEDFKVYMVKGADGEFLRESSIPLQARADGYETDRAVWDAVSGDSTLAVIDLTALGDDFFAFGGDSDVFRLQGLKSDVTSFEPVTLEVRDGASGASETVRVIGVLKMGASGGGDPTASFFGLIGNRELVDSVFGGPELTTYYVRLADKGEAVDIARNIEATLLTTGAQASSMKKDRQEDSALFNSFFYLMQAFAGLGLFVGIAAVGVVAFRSVVERRQQIGMLRAMGFTRGLVATSFLIESTFIALLGVLSGIGLAILLATFLLTSDEFSTAGITTVIIPWEQIGLIGVFALAATLLMSFLPARQAASVPIAEALRYE